MQNSEFKIGSGKLSSVLSLFLGSLSLGAVACLYSPDLLTTAEGRAHYPMPLLRLVIHAAAYSALCFGLLGVWLRKTLGLGATGFTLASLALMLGGGYAQGSFRGTGFAWLNLDWFLLSILILAIVFVPLERVFPLRASQKVFREQWGVDLTYFASSHLFVQLLTLLSTAPVLFWFSKLPSFAFQKHIAAQPLPLQFLEAALVADLATYSIHRLFHKRRILWRFHAVHHSSTSMDWLAGSRLHFVDIVVTRAWGFVPLLVLGFSQTALYAYLVFASVHAVWIHSNTTFDFEGIRGGKILRWCLATPRFHHWHHAAEDLATDKNFAIHFPFIDRLFGTEYYPSGRWPTAYGLVHGKIPGGFLGQLFYPFCLRRKA